MVPPELQDYKQWVCWTRIGKTRTKLPICAETGKPASCAAPTNWASYSHARAAAARLRLDGIGFVFTTTDPYTGVDLDHCRTKGANLESWAAEIVTRLGSYTEWSPSGEGLHILVKASLPERSGRRSHGIEIYSSARYFTITGNHLEGTPTIIENRQAGILDLVTAFDRESKTHGEPSRPPVSAAGSDEELIRRARQAKNGAKFQRLWAGDLFDYDGDHSRADAALCWFLAYYTNGDLARIDRLCRLSGLYRQKWDRPTAGSTYGSITIQAALRNGFPQRSETSTLSLAGGFYR